MATAATGERLKMNSPEVLAYSNCPVANALVVATGLGAIAQEGIELRVLSGKEGTLHFTYDHPAYTRFGGEIPPLISEGLRAPGRTRLLGITLLRGKQGYYTWNEALAGNPSSLLGKKIGVSRAAMAILKRDLGNYLSLEPWSQTLFALGTWEARALLHTLEAGGLGLGDITLLPIESPGVDVPKAKLEEAKSLKGADLFPKPWEQQSALLSSGEVDALFSWLPWGAELESRGARLVWDLGQDPRNTYASVWTISSALVNEKPDVVLRLMEAAVQAAKWAKSHGDEAASLHAKNLGVSVEAVKKGFSEDFHKHLLPRLDDEALAVLEQTQDFLEERGLLPKRVNLHIWAAPQFLRQSLEKFNMKEQA